MARKQKLRVYRTPIGFHDAYVAATSQKEALKAWGADVDLFARGVAEAVSDEKLAEEPLAKPGKVVRRVRGTSEEHMAALPKDAPPARRKQPREDDDEGPRPRPRRKGSGTRVSRERPDKEPETPRRKAEPASKREAPPPSKRRAPRPSRAKLEAAEKAIEQAETVHAARIDAIRQKEKDLQRERRDLERRHEAEIAGLEASLAKVRDAYTAALQKWRD